jgi:hypothetical protein
MKTKILCALVSLAGVGLGGCTTLGPMPATTGVIAPPAGRPDVQVQAGVVPGYLLSQTTQQDAKGSVVQQGSGMFEPNKLLGTRGLAVGGRYVGGGDSAGYVEPMVAYRGHFDSEGATSGVAVAYGTHSEGSSNGADYSATQGGLELGADARLTPKSPWVEVHAFGSASLTGLAASGHYCLDADGYGADCGDTDVPVPAKASGFYPAATAGLAFDFGQHLDSVFHGGRLAFVAAAGSQPSVQNGTQQPARYYTSGGITLTLGVGAL